jgi:hypothetical protein
VILKSIEEFNLIVGKFRLLALHRLYNYWKFRWFQSHIVWKLAFKSPENSLFSYHHKRLEKVPVGIIFVWPIFTIIITSKQCPISFVYIGTTNIITRYSLFSLSNQQNIILLVCWFYIKVE